MLFKVPAFLALMTANVSAATLPSRQAYELIAIGMTLDEVSQVLNRAVANKKADAFTDGDGSTLQIIFSDSGLVRAFSLTQGIRDKIRTVSDVFDAELKRDIVLYGEPEHIDDTNRANYEAASWRSGSLSTELYVATNDPMWRSADYIFVSISRRDANLGRNDKDCCFVLQ